MNENNSENMTTDVEVSLPRKSRGRKMTLEKLPHSTYLEFLAFIEAGAFDHVAASALGITPSTLARWLKKGAKAKSGKYRDFYLDIMEARGKARLLAETRVFADDPKFWLTRGPGKTTPELPGWSDDSKLLIDVEHSGEVGVSSPIAPQSTLAGALCELEKLGFIQRTSMGEKLFQEKQLLSQDSDLSSGNGEDIIDVEPEDQSDD